MKNVLELNDSIDGSRIKQGDQSVMRYYLTDGSGDDLKLDDKDADVFLYDASDVVYKYETTVFKDSNNAYAVDFVITDVVPARIYNLEIIVDNQYVFPSDDNTKIEVMSSVLGKIQNGAQIKPSVYEELIDYGVYHGMFDYLKGEQGDKGDVGPQGPQGVQGPMGDITGTDGWQKVKLTDNAGNILFLSETDFDVVESYNLTTGFYYVSNAKGLPPGVTNYGYMVYKRLNSNMQRIEFSPFNSAEIYIKNKVDTWSEWLTRD